MNGMRFLVVDDELVSRKKLQRALSAMGRCDAAEGGAEALEAFERAWADLDPYDVVCLDLNMPGMDGLEAARRIREAESVMEIGPQAASRIVMVTIQAGAEMVTKALQAGCNDYILKPFTLGTVREKIEHLFWSIPKIDDASLPEPDLDAEFWD